MSTSRNVMQEVSPKLAELTADMLFGDVWERPELSKRDRSLITVANLVALYRTDQLRGHKQYSQSQPLKRTALFYMDCPDHTAPFANRGFSSSSGVKIVKKYGSCEMDCQAFISR